MDPSIFVVILWIIVSRYLKECRSDSPNTQVLSPSDTDVIFGDSFATGMVSIDCLRCLCYASSNCEPLGCWLDNSQLVCGYFQMKYTHWVDCGQLGTDDWKECANDVKCSSLCIQKYMERYATQYNCNLNCEGFSREHAGGPVGCNDEKTLAFWETVQKEPGCKGVELIDA